MKNKFLKIVFLHLILIIASEKSFACMYGPPYKTVCETYAEANSVIIGKIESVNPDGSNQIVSIKVEKTYKGQTQKKIVLNQPQSTCDWDFSDEIGKTLLLYLVHNKETKKYSAIAEGMGGRVERQSENLYWLNNLPKSLNRTRISGTIELYKDEPFEFLNNLIGTKVKIFNDDNSFEVLTDKNGVYEIWDIPTGKYQIQPMFSRNYELDMSLSNGLVDFDTLNKIDPENFDVLIDIQPKGCGGIDFTVNDKATK